MKNMYIPQGRAFIIGFLFLLLSFNAFAQVGIGNTDPKSALDVNGALSLREGTPLNLVSGNNDVSLGTTIYSHYRITGPSGDFYIRNITPQSNSNGQILTLINTTNFPMTIKHNAGPGSFPERRIYCPSGYNLVLEGQNSTVTLQYNTSLQKWVVIGYADLGGYGRNVYNSIGTTDINTNSDSFGSMDDMSIIFTPKHSVVYVNFSASGTMDKGTLGDSQGYAAFQIERGSTAIAATTALATDRSYIDTGAPIVCRENFYDTGGAGGDYSNNENYTTVFTPTNPGEKVSVKFDAFRTEWSWDGMMIYNGANTNPANLISSGSTYNNPACPNGAWTGPAWAGFSAEGLTFTSTAADGALTFVFTSDGNTRSSGWVACVTSNVGAPPSSYSLDSAWNAGFTMYPVSVTPGVPTTIKINWLRDGLFPNVLRNNATNTDRAHRNITIFD